MEEHPSNDPLGFIGQNRNTSLSQEEELLQCPLARQSQQFLDSDSQSQWMTSSPPNLIIMESPPDSNPLLDDDKFLTPPEHHLSDSDNLKSNGDDLEPETTLDLGFQGGGCDCVIKDHQMEVVGSGFRENGVLGDGIDCAKSSQETENVETETSDLNSGETVVLCGNDEIKGVDEVKGKSRVDLGGDKGVGAGGDLGFGMEGNLDEEQCDCIVRDVVTKVGCEFDKIGVLDREFVSEKVTFCEEELKLGGFGIGNGCVGNIEHVENTDTDITLDPEEDTNEGDEVSKRKLLDENFGDDRGLSGLSRGENELVDGEVRERVNLSEYCQDTNGIENGGNEEDVRLERTGKRKRRGGKRKLRGTDKTNMRKSKEDIEKFKYVKTSDGVEQRGREENRRVNDETVSGKGNVPLAKRSECPMSEGGQGSAKNENIRFMNFLNKAAELLKREVESDTEVDLMETLKKKGVKFPRPSWWPPEGFH